MSIFLPTTGSMRVSYDAHLLMARNGNDECIHRTAYSRHPYEGCPNSGVIVSLRGHMQLARFPCFEEKRLDCRGTADDTEGANRGSSRQLSHDGASRKVLSRFYIGASSFIRRLMRDG